VSDDKPVMLPPWVRGLGKYAGVVLPMVFAGYLAFHDLQQDFVLEQAKVVALTERVKSLETAKQAREVRDARLDESLTYIRKSLDGLTLAVAQIE